MTTNVPAPTASSGAPAPAARLLRIREVAELVGLTARSIRYYEELGLLKPAGRSECAYRQYDDDDLDRLRFIKAMRDDAGFSLADIGQLLEDEQARARSREQLLAATSPAQRRTILRASLDRLEGQLVRLREKVARLETMIDGVEERRERVSQRLAELEPRSGARPARPARPARSAEAEPAGSAPPARPG